MHISSQANSTRYANNSRRGKGGPDDVEPEFPERHQDPGPDDVYDPDFDHRRGRDDYSGPGFWDSGSDSSGPWVLF